MQRFGLAEILLLSAFRATTKQNDERFAVPRQIDAVTRPPVDDVAAFDAKTLLHNQANGAISAII